MILAIDPGNTESAYVLMNEQYRPIEFAKVENGKLLDLMTFPLYDKVAIEMVASYGMAVGKEVFDTCVWIGRFWQKAEYADKTMIYRRDVKLNLCGQTRAKDSNIIQALIDRFGGRKSKKNPDGFFPPIKENGIKTGWSDDVWQAYALAVTYLDQRKITEANDGT